jgi:Flp pilus assembly protein TadD
VAAYKREIELSPQHLQSYANLAVIYFIEGKRGEAEKTLALMTRNNPNRGARSLVAKTRAAIGLR